MNCNSIIVFLISVIGFQKCDAQTITINSNKCYGGSGIEDYPKILFNKNLNILSLIGNSNSYLSGNKTSVLCDSLFPDIWYLKLDTSLTINFQASIGGSKKEDYPSVINNGSSFLIATTSNSDSSCQKKTSNHLYQNVTTGDIWLFSLDTTGSVIWEKTYGTSGTEEGSKALKCTSGEFLILNGSNGGLNGDKTSPNFGNFDYWLIKTDSLGNKIWDNSYGGTLLEMSFNTGFCGMDIIEIYNNKFIIGGTTLSINDGTISQLPHGAADIYLIKIDSSGYQIWDKRYGGANSEFAEKIITTSDSGFIVLGMTVSAQGGDVTDAPRGDRDIWLLKLDSNGNKVWDKRYGGSQRELANSIVATSDGGYYISGSTLSDSSYEVTEHGYGGYDYWFLKVDSVGNKLWDKRFGGPGDDMASNFIVLADSSIILSGYAESGTSAVKTDLGYGLEDYWLVHFKYEDSVTTNISQLNSNLQFIIHPNPAYTEFTIKLNDLNPVKLVVYDVMGKIILQQQVVSSAAIPVQYLESGIYIVEVHDINGQSSRKKLVKQ